MSMSTGDLVIEGARARYELRMPIYEIAHVKSPEPTLMSAIQFATMDRPAKLLRSSCRDEPAQGFYLCRAEYEFAGPVDILEAECRFHTVTVPNHVHLLRVVNGSKRDQAIFDSSFSNAEIRFRPPTAFEMALKQISAGALRAVGGWVQILFLAALALASRGGRELVALFAAFAVGQLISVVAAPLVSWQPAPRFVEAAMALTVAYLAVEVLALPKAGQRWAVAGVLGVFHGLYFALFIQSSEFQPGWVLTGASGVELAITASFAFALSRAGRPQWLTRAASAALLCIGLGWFFLRLKA